MSIKQAIEALETCLAMAEHGDFSTGYCCCGSSVEGHTMGDGHSPVDEGDYHALNAVEKARAALAALRSMPAEPVAYAGRVAQLEAALQAAGDLAASSRSGPAKAESLQGIEEICTEALERRGDQFALFVPQVVHDIANEICQAVAELPDRNSPEDWPEAMLVTHDELQFIVTEAIAALTTTSGDSHG